MSEMINIDLNDDRWEQASLPIRWGELGVRGAKMLAPSAFLASAAGTTELVNLLLRNVSNTTIDDNNIRAALVGWSLQGGKVHPIGHAASVQRIWENAASVQRIW